MTVHSEHEAQCLVLINERQDESCDHVVSVAVLPFLFLELRNVLHIGRHQFIHLIALSSLQVVQQQMSPLLVQLVLFAEVEHQFSRHVERQPHICEVGDEVLV